MGNFLTKNFPYLLMAGFAYWFYNKTDKAVKVITRPVAAALAEVQFALNGSHYIKVPRAGFFLNPEKLVNWQVRDKVWLKAMTMTHDDHADLIEQIFTPDLHLRPEFQSLLGQAVTQDAINTALKG